MKKIIRPIITVLLLTASASCSKYLDQTEFYELLQETSENLVIGEKLTNPYSISVMREALAILRSSGVSAPETIEPNCLYVRFDVKDSLQYSTLEKKGLELYTYPLDYEIISEGTEPALTADNQQPKWIYTTVPVNFDFSSAPFYELLDSCYVPGCFPSTKGADSLLDGLLEETAISVSGDECTPQTKAGGAFRPDGTISVNHTEENEIKPLPGVRVRSRYFLKSSTTYTDDKGHYTIDAEFKGRPTITVEFKSNKGFTIWNGLWVLSPAKMSLGKWSDSLRNVVITDKNNKWSLCILSSTIYDYYNFCMVENIPQPPPGFKVMMFKGDSNKNAAACAPMLRRLPVVFLRSEASVLDVIADFALVPVSAASLFLFKWGMPDMIIRAGWMNEGQSRTLKYHIWHELSHASHWRMAGNDIWCDYVGAIFTHGLDYGSSDAKHSEIIDLGESCAQSIVNYDFYKNYKTLRYYTTDKFNDGKKFNVYFPTRLLEEEIITPEQLFRAMGPKTKSIRDLKNVLMEQNPDKKYEIDKIWAIEYTTRSGTKK